MTAVVPDVTPVDGATPTAPEVDAPIPGEEALGDPGKKALDAMKAKWKAAEDRARAAETAAAEALAKAQGREAEFAAEQERRNVEAAALAKANERIVKAEIRAAAKGVLQDPADAFRYLDVSSIAVDDDGNPDEGAIAQAIAELVASKPYLGAGAAQSPRFQGTADQGARDAHRPAQLSRTDLAGMTAEQITQAKAEGRLNDLLGLK